MTEALRTPPDRFENLPDFPWAAKYTDTLPGYSGLRMAYIDEGPKDAPVFLCLHGQPTWSYLYRKMIPVFLNAGARVIAPDMFGFGQSDKPVADDIYTYDFHRNSLLALIAELDLQNITLVCQDWGGLLGLTLPMAESERFKRMLVMNTVLALGASPSDGFLAWQKYSLDNPDYDISRLMQRSVPQMSNAEAAAYNAPFPDARFKAGVRRFPAMVMTKPDMDGVAVSKQAAKWFASQWQGDTFMAVGMQDVVITPETMQWLHGVLQVKHEALLLPNAGHFVQETGAEVAQAALEAWG